MRHRKYLRWRLKSGRRISRMPASATLDIDPKAGLSRWATWCGAVVVTFRVTLRPAAGTFTCTVEPEDDPLVRLHVVSQAAQ
jgi:hypothetical protein